MHQIKDAIRNLEWALQELEEYTDEMLATNPDYEVKVIDNCCYQIRDAYRDLKDLL